MSDSDVDTGTGMFWGTGGRQPEVRRRQAVLLGDGSTATFRTWKLGTSRTVLLVDGPVDIVALGRALVELGSSLQAQAELADFEPAPHD